MPSQQKTERAFQSMQAYISNCPLGSKKQSNNFQFKNSLASKLIFPENQNLLITPLAVCALLLKERQPKGPDEEWNNQWWENGYHQQTEEQLKKRLHVTRETFESILETVTDDIAKERAKVQRADFSPVPTCTYLISFSSWLLSHHRSRPLRRSSIQ